MDSTELTGTLFDIQGFSLHDGPGCRTLVFLKGCPLSCRWCSNPEGNAPHPEPLYRRSACTLDLSCVEACPFQAISVNSDHLRIDRDPCRSCFSFACTDACCTGALRRGGYRMSVGELYAVISRDRQYWGSQGGITLTGGEPFFQPGFAAAILKQCHEAYIHTSAESCLLASRSDIEPSLEFLDWLFVDLKHMDPVRHAEWTGLSNELILANARWLAAVFPGRMVYRMTLVPGFNDQPEHLVRLAGFIRSSGRNELNILPLHHLGREKYKLIDRPYYTRDLSVTSPECLRTVQEILEEEGVTCYTGSETPF